jgi:histone acetyltransferase (RNA polymerase elongator complex component)
MSDQSEKYQNDFIEKCTNFINDNNNDDELIKKVAPCNEILDIMNCINDIEKCKKLIKQTNPETNSETNTPLDNN